MVSSTHREPGHVPLFWRLFLPNAAVLAAASVVIIIAPPRGRVLIVLGGLVAMLAVTLALMRHAFGPLERLGRLTQQVDPLEPGRRLQIDAPPSEVTEVAHAFNAMLDRLEEERRESARRHRSAEDEERRRLARELHDEVGQCLTAVKLLLERALREATPPVADALVEAREATTGALDSVRRLSRELRPEALDDLGLESALAALGDRLSEQTGVKVRSRLSRSLPPLTREQELALYRIAQESVTNAIRHGAGSSVEVALEARDGRLVLRVIDGGPGLVDGDGGGTGILGMRERALLIGASLTLEPAPGGGLEVRLDLPVDGASR